MKTCARACGFTLLELLIAMAVTAMVGVIAWQFLDSALRVSAQGESVLEEVNALEQFWQMLDMDLQQSRGTFRFQEEASAAQGLAMVDFMGGDTLLNAADLLPSEPGERPWLLLLRDASPNPLQTGKSGLQRVLYTLRDGALLRHTWTERNLGHVPDRVSRRILVRGIKGLDARFLADLPGSFDTQWQTTWPVQETNIDNNPQLLAGPDSTLPLAVTLTLQTEVMGDVERIFTLPGA